MARGIIGFAKPGTALAACLAAGYLCGKIGAAPGQRGLGSGAEQSGAPREHPRPIDAAPRAPALPATGSVPAGAPADKPAPADVLSPETIRALGFDALTESLEVTPAFREIFGLDAGQCRAVEEACSACRDAVQEAERRHARLVSAEALPERKGDLRILFPYRLPEVSSAYAALDANLRSEIGDAAAQILKDRRAPFSPTDYPIRVGTEDSDRERWVFVSVSHRGDGFDFLYDTGTLEEDGSFRSVSGGSSHREEVLPESVSHLFRLEGDSITHRLDDRP